MHKVRVYVEGGGPPGNVDGRQQLRAGFQDFLREFASANITVIASGGASETIRDFRRGIEDHSEDSLVVLLVDSDGPVSAPSRREHLESLHGCELHDVDEDQVHLMVQAMEAWLLADRDAIFRYCDERKFRFAVEQLPDCAPEEILGSDLKNTIRNAGLLYHEIRQGAKLIALVSPAVVRDKCPHCRALFDVLCARTGVELAS